MSERLQECDSYFKLQVETMIPFSVIKKQVPLWENLGKVENAINYGNLNASLRNTVIGTKARSVKRA